MAPEYYRALKESKEDETLNYEKCDIFSLGIIIL